MSVPFRAIRLNLDPRAIDVQFDDENLCIVLVDGRKIAVPLKWFPRLLNATVEQRSSWRLIGSGVGVSWEQIDEDIEVEGLLRLD